MFDIILTSCLVATLFAVSLFILYKHLERKAIEKRIKLLESFIKSLEASKTKDQTYISVETSLRFLKHGDDVKQYFTIYENNMYIAINEAIDMVQKPNFSEVDLDEVIKRVVANKMRLDNLKDRFPESKIYRFKSPKRSLHVVH